jgi:hypothetical protein
VNSRFYTITFTTPDGIVQCGRSFASLRAARKWAKWVAAQPYASAVKLYRGGPGGMLEEAA